MNWEEKLKELSSYDIAFEVKQGYYHFSLKYPNNWNIIVSENDNIYIEQRNDVCHYIASTDNTTIDDIFNVINETIEYNTDLEKKLQLFKEKVAKLQELFSVETYQRLKTIEFVFPKQKKTVKKKTKQKEENVENTPILQTNEETTETTAINDYDANEEIVVTAENEFIEELERK